MFTCSLGFYLSFSWQELAGRVCKCLLNDNYGVFGLLWSRQQLHCKPGQFKPAYIECGNGAVAMQLSQAHLFELGTAWLCPFQINSLDLLALPQHRSHIQCKLVQLVRVYSVLTVVSVHDIHQCCWIFGESSAMERIAGRIECYFLTTEKKPNQSKHLSLNHHPMSYHAKLASERC